MAKLTAKQRLFTDAVEAGKSNKDAAIAAGYSVKTAMQAGSRLARDPAIAAHLSGLKLSAKAKAEAPDQPAPVEQKAAPAFSISEAMLHSDPKHFLMAAMNDGELDDKLRIDAAKALMPFVHGKIGDAGKKDQRQDAAKKVAGGKFAAAAPPRLVANNGTTGR